MKYLKKAVLFMLILSLLVSLFLPAVSAVSINDDSVFLKQPRGSTTCTLVSAVMMLRRRAILNGNANWASITVEAVKPVAWGSDGLAYNFTYAGMRVQTYGMRSDLGLSTIAQKRDYLIRALQEHPEGIVIYNHSTPHAVLLTDYDRSSGVFYCADPAPSAASGRIPLVNCIIPGSTQDAIIGNLNQIWLITSGGGHVHSYTLYCESEHPHKLIYKCDLCGDSYYPGGTTTVNTCILCNPVRIITDVNTLELSLPDNPTATIHFTANGVMPDNAKVKCSFDGNFFNTTTGYSQLTVTAKAAGTTTITFYVENPDGSWFTSTDVTVHIKDNNAVLDAATNMVNLDLASAPTKSVNIWWKGVPPPNGGMELVDSNPAVATSRFVSYDFDAKTAVCGFTAHAPGNSFTTCYIKDASGKIVSSFRFSVTVAASRVKYTVYHWLEDLEEGTFTRHKEEIFWAAAGTTVTPSVPHYEGFEDPKPQSAVVKADGSTIISLDYKRASYGVMLQYGTGIASVSNGGSYRYGETVTLTATPKAGYHISSWKGPSDLAYQASGNQCTFQMPAWGVGFSVEAAKDASASLEGTITSAGNASDPVTVIVNGVKTSINRVFTGKGNSMTYRFPDLEPDTYFITIRKKGHATYQSQLVIKEGRWGMNYALTLLGDVYQDKQVNAKDIALLQKHLANPSAHPLYDYAKTAADVYQDGKLTAKDLAKLRRYVANPSKYPLE